MDQQTLSITPQPSDSNYIRTFKGISFFAKWTDQWTMTYTVKHQVKRTRVNAIIKCVCNPLSPLIQRPAETLRCVVCDLCWRMVGRPKDSTRETRRRFRNGGEIYYLQHISYLVYQAHTLQLTHGISDNRTHETYGSPRGTNNITANKL